jgi:hypothetical protein
MSSILGDTALKMADWWPYLLQPDTKIVRSLTLVFFEITYSNLVHVFIVIISRDKFDFGRYHFQNGRHKSFPLSNFSIFVYNLFKLGTCLHSHNMSDEFDFG